MYRPTSILLHISIENHKLQHLFYTITAKYVPQQIGPTNAKNMPHAQIT